jgi:MFS family permease
MAQGVASVEFGAGVSTGTQPSARGRLLIMMFLEFFIWGAWLPLIFGYLPSLGFSPLQQSWVLNAFALASFAGMFFSNQFADRNFSAERFLAASHLIGGMAILGLFWTDDLTAKLVHAGGGAVAVNAKFIVFFVLMLIHCLFYVPTISICNSIAFANLKDAKKEFGLVRLGGTIGWIAASWPFVFILVDWARVPAFGSVSFSQWLGSALGTSKSGPAALAATRYTFLAAGVASLLLAAFSLTLPHTPPRPAKAGAEKFAWLEAMRLLKVPFLLVLFIVTFLDAGVHQCYFIWTNDFLKSVGIPANWVMAVMSIGQVAEISTMALLGVVLKKLGWRTTLILGILGHAVRFGVFALAPEPWLAVSVIMLHGICYAFFFATVYIFVDEFFPKDARTSAQGLFNFLILGFGPFVANFVWPFLGAQVIGPVAPIEKPAPNVIHVGTQYRNLTIKGTTVPNGKVLITYEDGAKESVKTEATADGKGDWMEATQFVATSKGNAYTISAASADPPGVALPGSIPVTITGAEQVDFKKLFLVPSGTAVFAALMLLIFFHPPKKGKAGE